MNFFVSTNPFFIWNPLKCEMSKLQQPYKNFEIKIQSKIGKILI